MVMQTKSEQILQEKYDTWMEQKLTLSDPWYKMVMKMLKPVFPDFSGKQVLEVGCGLGVFCINIAKQNGQVTGFDISKNALLKAKELSAQFNVKDKTEFIIGDARYLPFVSKSHDLIVCSEVLEHIENHQLAFHEFARLADQSGYVCITVPNLLSSLFFEIIFFKIMGQPKFVQRFLYVEKEYIFHYYKVKRLVNSERLSFVDVRGVDYVHIPPKISGLLKINRLIELVSSKLETKNAWRYFGANIGVIAQKNFSS
jgi:ubiquinone/menaquinone biosynthesis C-methylase UbiE